jgi:hypothetical protein
MATTTNYSWTTPDDTDLVKDGAAAIRTLGSSVDTTTKALNPSTTLGDIEYRSSTANTNTRLGIGTTGQILTVSGGVPAWGAAPSAGANWTLLNAGGTALTGAQTVTISSVPTGTDKIMVLVKNASSASAGSYIQVRLNTDTGSNYYTFVGSVEVFSGYQTNWLSHDPGSARAGIRLMLTGNSAGNDGSGMVMLTGCNASGVKSFTVLGASTGVNSNGYWGGGYYDSSSVISSVSINSATGDLDAGTVYVYTSA